MSTDFGPFSKELLGHTLRSHDVVLTRVSHLQLCPARTVEMPQTSKSASGGSVPGQGEPPQDVRNQAATGGGDGTGPTEDQEDPEIIKSPSDPKKYRWETDQVDL